MQTLTRSRLLGLAVVILAGVALAGCGGPKRSVTTTVARTVPVPAVAVAGGTAVTPTSVATAAPAAPAPEVNHRKTRATMVAGAVSFGVIGQAVVDQGVVAGGAAASGATSGATSGAGGLAGAGGAQQCQNPFGSQAASNGQLICSADQERLQCQCDANGCQLVPTGILACLPAGAVYQ